jgi:hypothetical protein
MCPFARTIGVVSLTITRWPSPTWSPTPTRPPTYTKSWDITVEIHANEESMSTRNSATKVKAKLTHIEYNEHG